MDVSTLFSAPNTATSTAGLSFGALTGTGSGAVSGDGPEGLDSFDQLLGNFLSLTGGEMPADATGDGTVALLADGAMSMPSPPTALTGGGLLTGLNNLALSAGTGTTARGMEGRWAQSGLTLLSGGGLAGQEMNEEVVAFLNDLSGAFKAGGGLVEPTIGTDAEAGAKAGSNADTAAHDGMVETPALSQGDMPVAAAAGAPAPMMPVAAPVIPLATDPAAPAPGPLGVTLTVAGTGLKTLPSVPAPEDKAIPAAAPVIPRMGSAPALVEASAAPPPRTPAASAPAPADSGMATAPIAVRAEGAAPARPAPAVPADTNTPAIAMSPEPASDTGMDRPVVTAEPAVAGTAAKTAEPAREAPTSPRPTVSPPPAPVMTPDTPVQAVAKGPSPTPVGDATAAAAATAAPPPDGADNGPATVTRAEIPAPSPDAGKPAAPTGPTVALKVRNAPPPTQAETPAALTTGSETLAEAEAAPAETPTTNAHAAPTTVAGAGTTARPAVTAARTPAQAAPAQTAATPDAEPAADAAEAAPVEDEDASNQRMLAPRHIGADARAEAQAEMAGPAQTAGQNTTAGRADMAAPTVNGEREDNLLARAVTAAGKAHEGELSGGETGAGADHGMTTEAPDGLSTAATGDPARTQGSDFAQSLRQTAAPHRPNAYMPPAHQMAMQVQRAIQDGNERLSIRLNPQELGRIDVQLEIGSEGKLRAKVMVENPQTLEMLQKDARTLEKALQDAGLQTDQNSLAFSLQDHGDQARERQDRQEQSGHGTALASDEDEQEDPAILAQAQILELGRVDVRV